MRNYKIIIGICLCIQPWHANATSLQEAMNIAEKQHPLLYISKINIETARANLREQQAYAYNPEFSIEPQRRNLKGGGSSNDYYLGLSQGIELAGKQTYRKVSAEAALKVTQLEQHIQRQRIIFDAARAYVYLVFSERTLALRQHQLETLKKLKVSIAKQQELGELTQLDVNLAQASLTQAIGAEVQAKQFQVLNMSKYRLALGYSYTSQIIPPATLPQLSLNQGVLDHALNIALTSRPELQALQQQVAQYLAQADLAKAQRTPDLAVSFATGREAGDQIYSVALSMPIPVLNRHDGAYRAALSQVLAKKAELRWLKQRVQLEVIEAQNQQRIAMQALASVIQKAGSTETQINLAKAAFDAGELDTEELVIHINQILESRINTETIFQQGWLARIRLAEVLGKPEYLHEGMK